MFYVKKMALLAIRFYQKYVSPYNWGCCRFEPTCSVYAYRAIEKYGFLKGSIIAFKRFIRCNPFCKKYGYDPVPEEWQLRFLRKRKK